MSYISWRKDHEEKILTEMNNGGLEVSFNQDTRHSEELETITKTVIRSMLHQNNMNLISFPILFGEYLYQTYQVAPADIELMAQMITELTFREMRRSSIMASAMTAGVSPEEMLKSMNDADHLYLDEMGGIGSR